LEHEVKTMFAVIKTGGKQYRVAANDVITVAKLEAEPGQAVTFDNVLMFTNDGGTHLGVPTVAGIAVAGEVVEQARGPKVIAFKKRRRQNSKRKRGHRQDLTVVRITEILTGGARPQASGESARAASGESARAGSAPASEAASAPAPVDAAPSDGAAAEKKPRAPRGRAKTAETGEPTAE
jgi:large subunit ribosomal protein L21